MKKFWKRYLSCEDPANTVSTLQNLAMAIFMHRTYLFLLQSLINIEKKLDRSQEVFNDPT